MSQATNRNEQSPLKPETVWAWLAVALLVGAGIGLYEIIPKAHHYTGTIVSITNYVQADVFNELQFSRLNITVIGIFVSVVAGCQGFYHIGEQVTVYEYDSKWDLEHNCK